MTYRSSKRRSSTRRSSRRLQTNPLRRSALKAYPKNKGFEDADWAWVRKSFPAVDRRIRVTAFRKWEGVPRDAGLEQHFDGDPTGLRQARAYAKHLVKEGVAVSVYIEGQVYLRGYFPKPWGGTWHHEWVVVETLENVEAAR